MADHGSQMIPAGSQQDVWIFCLYFRTLNSLLRTISQLDLDDGFFFQRAEILSKSLLHFTFIIIPQNPLLDLLKGKRLYSFSIKEFNDMETKFRSYDPV